MTSQARQALERALVLSHQLLAAADQSSLQELAHLDAERMRLLQSVSLERDNLSAGDWLVLKEVSELNDRAIGLMEHHRRSKERALDMAAVGRRAVAAYSTTRLQRWPGIQGGEPCLSHFWAMVWYSKRRCRWCGPQARSRKAWRWHA